MVGDHIHVFITFGQFVPFYRMLVQVIVDLLFKRVSHIQWKSSSLVTLSSRSDCIPIISTCRKLSKCPCNFHPQYWVIAILALKTNEAQHVYPYMSMLPALIGLYW